MFMEPLCALRIIRSAGLTAACMTILACSNGYLMPNVNGEKKVSRVDEEEGKGKTLVYEADQTEQYTHVGLVPKRRPDHPIYVDLAPPVLDDNMQRAERSKGVVAEQIRREFVGDPSSD